jgi:hypothetical protein
MRNKANKAKLRQTADTPFMTGDIQEDVGWVGICPAVYMMLDGTYTPPPPEEVDEYTTKLIKQFRQIAKQLNTTSCMKSLERNGSPSGKDQQSGRHVDVVYFILEHGNKDPSVRPLRNWLLYSQTSDCKLDIL